MKMRETPWSAVALQGACGADTLMTARGGAPLNVRIARQSGQPWFANRPSCHVITSAADAYSVTVTLAVLDFEGSATLATLMTTGLGLGRLAVGAV